MKTKQQQSRRQPLAPDPLWEELAKAHGIDHAKIDRYARHEVKRVVLESASEPQPQNQKMPWPKQIPTADAMIDQLSRDNSTHWQAQFYESIIFDSWLRLKARQSGYLPPVTISTREFVDRYWGTDDGPAPRRLEGED